MPSGPVCQTVQNCKINKKAQYSYARKFDDLINQFFQVIPLFSVTAEAETQIPSFPF